MPLLTLLLLLLLLHVPVLLLIRRGCVQGGV
jgi:hypothetical protein